MFAAILVAIAVSIDSLSIGVAYGIRGLRIPFKSILIIASISFVVVILSMILGGFVIDSLSEDVAKLISSGILILLAFWMVGQRKKKAKDQSREELGSKFIIYNIRLKSLGVVISILKEPTKADMDISGSIDMKEALFLGAALALDSFGVGIGAAAAGASIILTPIMVVVFSVMFIVIGLKVGKRYLKALSHSSKIEYLAPIILISLAILRVVN